MARTILTWTVFLGSLFGVGALAWWIAGPMLAPDAITPATPLLSSSPFSTTLRTLAASLVAILGGAAAARLLGPRWGFFCAGMPLAWVAWRSGGIEQAARLLPESGLFWRLALEGGLLAALAIPGAWLIGRLGAAAHAAAHPPSPSGHQPDRSPWFWVAALLTMVAAAIVATVVAQNTLKGQALAAAAIGGLIGTCFGRLTAARVPEWSLVTATAALAAAAPLAAAFFAPSGVELLETVNASRLFGPSRIVPLEWVAGAFLGVPLGANWVGSLVERRHPGPH